MCYTIGHSNHRIEKFFELLHDHNIDCLFDVRSSPHSTYLPQYNKEALSINLKENNIRYVYVGDSLGARYCEKQYLFPDGKVNFSRVRERKEYILGIQKIINQIKKGSTVTIMCSEKEPYDCHRFVLISYSLVTIGLNVEHILEDSSTISNLELEKRLKNDYLQTDLLSFSNNRIDDSIERLYEKRNKEIAFNAFE